MKIHTPTFTQHKNQIEVSSQIELDNGQTHEVYVLVDKKDAKFLSHDSTAFASPFVFPASRKGEDLVIQGSVSQRWLQGVGKIVDRIVGWDHGFKPINVWPEATHQDSVSTKQVGVFFSGGVDSFSSLVKHHQGRKLPITHLIFVHGYDIRIDNKTSLKKVLPAIKAAAKEVNLPLIVVSTNIREITDQLLGWEMAHGGALALVALLLRNGFSRIIIPGGGYVDWYEPWGSSQYLDPLWRTESLEIVHDFDQLMRWQKVERYIAASPIALKYVRVCWRNKSYNCGECDKCLITMAELRMAGCLDKCRTFPNQLDLEKLSGLYQTYYSNLQYVEQIHARLKETQSDPELLEAIEKCLEYSRRPGLKRNLINTVHYLDWKYNESRLYVWLRNRKMI